MTNILTVSELNNIIKGVIKDNLDNKIKVGGEISNLRMSRGHLYLTLKDKDSVINVVMWNYEKLDKNIKNLKDGDKVVIDGTINVYPKGGYYNINAYNIAVQGVGDIKKDYNMHKDIYEQLGYFDPTKKKPLPQNIDKIGVITAIDGAAIKDFLYVLETGKFKGTIYIKNGLVQGADCPKSIAYCLDFMDTLNLDVLVITRGGGSFEDLMGFSHPDIIEALHRTNTCTISAIGHEIDTMLSDYVADVRAPTPSVAAEIVLRNQHVIYTDSFYENILDDQYYNIKQKISSYKYKLDSLESTIVQPNTIINNYLNSLNSTMNQIKIGLSNTINKFHNKCDLLDNMVDKCNPENVLENGYCMVVDSDQNRISTKIEFENSDKKLKIIFIDGIVDL